MIISYPPKIRQRVKELPQYKGMIKQRNINSYFIQREGGRLYGITKTGQHEYDDAI